MTIPSEQTGLPSGSAPAPRPTHHFTEAQRAADRAIVLVLVGLLILPMVLGPLALVQVHRTRRLGGERLSWVVAVAWFEIILGVLILAGIAYLLISLLVMSFTGQPY
ncbi:hypothetical protein [Nesterenkonia suensis]